MKNILFVTLALTYLTSKAQISLEHTYDSASTFNVALGGLNASSQLELVNFEVSGYQYVKINRWARCIYIYDLSHALVQTISLAGLPANSSYNTVGDVLYLSEHLFNNDSKKEFMYVKDAVYPTSCYTGIYNENGALLFSDTGAAIIRANFPSQQYPIYNTSSGTKMILSYSNGQAKVFSLGGTLSTSIQSTSLNLINPSTVSNPYPNPTNNSTTIDYKLPESTNDGTIVFYDLQGNEVKRFRVDRTFTSLLISTADIPAGTYYYQLQTDGNNSPGRKLVVIK
jgi:hypothetical protein